ncbi:MAG: hypothetical protein ABSA11_00845 [Candidatus Bathyarchaeia archaeon]|jgi:hypothetical protein
MTSTERNSNRATSLINITAFYVDGKNEDSSQLGHRILDSMASRYGLKPPQQDDFTLTFTFDGFQYNIKLIKRGACDVFLIDVSHSTREPSRRWNEDISAYQDRIQPLLKSLPDNPTAAFSVYSVYTGSRDEALTTFNEYSANQAQLHTGLGVIRGCLLAMFGDSQQGEGNQVVERNLLLSPFNSVDAEAVSSRLLEDISSLASIEGEINRLYRMRQPFFKLIGSVEEDTQKAIDEIFGNSLLNPNKLEDMEESLKVITGRFSTLSTMAGAVRRDNILVESKLDEVEDLFQRWNESEVEGYPTIFSMEMIHYKTLSKPFKDFKDRIESLKVELGTVLDTVRTRLSMNQQKLGVEEQKSSKDLLTKLVNLQEALNKLEILIVAFYITEMGGLFFEVIAHDVAPLLTVAFIPFAALTSFGLIHLMHKQRKE